MSMKVALIGGFNEARYLAKSLIDRGYHVTAINERLEECEILAEISKLNVFQGDGSKPFVLEDAGIYGSDIAIAMSPYDDANLVICELCKKRFNIKKTVALISDPKNTEFFKDMGVDSVVCAISVLSGIIEQHATLSEVNDIMPIGASGVQVEQVTIPMDAPVCGRKISEIKLPDNVIIGCITRGNRNIVPKGDTEVCSGDSLLLVVSEENKEKAVIKLIGR